MKKFLALSCVLSTLLFGMSYNTSFAATDNHKLTKAQEREIAQGLMEVGVAKEDQKKLIKKLERGELWDSLNPEKVKAVEDTLKVSPENPYARYVFEDGSVLSKGMLTPSTSAYPSLSGGTKYCGSGYCSFINVQVFRDDGLVKAYFYADYTNITNYSDRIDKVYNWNITVRGGTFSNNSLSVINSKEVSATYAAQAQLFFHWTVVGNLSNGINRLDLYVGQDTAWQGASW